jgi:hypothetical protein
MPEWLGCCANTVDDCTCSTGMPRDHISVNVTIRILRHMTAVPAPTGERTAFRGESESFRIAYAFSICTS